MKGRRFHYLPRGRDEACVLCGMSTADIEAGGDGESVFLSRASILSLAGRPNGTDKVCRPDMADMLAVMES